MSLITSGLVNQLDAHTLLTAGYVNGQSLISAQLPDNISSKGWSGDGYSINFSVSGSPYGGPCIVFSQGTLRQNNLFDFLNYTNMSVMIAATRTGPSWTGTWMGLYSMQYNHAKAGITILAITDNYYQGSFSGWGTYNDTNTVQSTSAMSLNTPIIVGAVCSNNSSGTFYTNSTQTGIFPSSKVNNYYGLGGLTSQKEFFVGNVYEVLVYNRALSASEVTSNAQYLSNKWFTPTTSGRTWATDTDPWYTATYTWANA